jgi:hypothetical protein
LIMTLMEVLMRAGMQCGRYCKICSLRQSETYRMHAVLARCRRCTAGAGVVERRRQARQALGCCLRHSPLLAGSHADVAAPAATAATGGGKAIQKRSGNGTATWSGGAGVQIRQLLVGQPVNICERVIRCCLCASWSFVDEQDRSVK